MISRVRLGGSLALLCAAWLVISISLANAWRRDNPSAALAIAPYDARAATILADGLVNSGDIARARAIASSALRREPISARTMRVVAFTSTLRNDPRAIEQFASAQRLSRRDLPTQLWLLERRVSKGDVAGALGHFRVALTTHAESAPVLFPILIGATGEATLLPALARFLKVPAPWRDGLLFRMASTGPSPATLDTLFTLLRRQGADFDDATVQSLIDRLVQGGQFAAAARQYMLATNVVGIGSEVQGGDFQRAVRFHPFDWTLANSGMADAALVGSKGHEAPTLAFHSYGAIGSAATLASRLLLLRPGQYMLRSKGSMISGRASPIWSLDCITGRPLLQPISAAAGDPRMLLRGFFSVPVSGCPAQWLRLRSASNEEDSEMAGSVFDLEVVHLSNVS